MPNHVNQTIAACLLSISCSVVEMKPLEATYDPRTQPRCETERIYAVGDALGTLLFAGLGTAMAIEGNGDDKVKGVVIGGVVTAVLLGSAIAGFSWAKSCDAAKAQWDQRQIEQDEHLHGDGSGSDSGLALDAKLPPTPVAPPVTPATPRGFFCTSSASVPTSTLCTREKADCERARTLSVGAVPDMSACALQETAFCSSATGGEPRCAPTVDACNAQRDAGSGSSNAAACVESR